MASEWDVKNGGISSFNIIFARKLLSLGFKVYCAVVTATPQQINDAGGIQLVVPKRATRREKLDCKNLSLLERELVLANDESKLFVSELSKDDKLVIVGHAHITGSQAFDQKEWVKRAVNCRVVLINHVIPELVDRTKHPIGLKTSGESQGAHGDKKQLELELMATQSDCTFSVGLYMFDWFETSFQAHQTKIPHYRLDPPLNPVFSQSKQPDAPVNRLQHRILCFGRTDGVLYSKGIDIFARAIKILQSRQRQVIPVLRGVPIGEGDSAQSELVKLTETWILAKEYASAEDCLQDARKSTICVMSSRCEPFGLVGLEAMAAGIPTLVTSNSGLALFLHRDLRIDWPIVKAELGTDDNATQTTVDAWVAKMEMILMDLPFYWTQAEKLQRKLKKKNLEKEVVKFGERCQELFNPTTLHP